MSQNTILNLSAIKATMASKDPVQRNLQITQTYSDINLELSKLMGKQNVSWCAYATWASKTAGQFIRKDNIDNTILDFLRDKDWVKETLSKMPSALNWFGWKMKISDTHIYNILNETAQAASHQVAEGNLLVFSELAPLYEKFISIASKSTAYQQEDLQEFLDYLNSFEEEKNGNEKLKQAFTAYYQAIFEEDEKTKAELIFMANVLVGYHEQIRLDPAINNSIQAPIEEVLKKKLLGNIDQWLQGNIPSMIYYFIHPYLKSKVEPMVNNLADGWREVSTKRLMAIEVPDGQIDLSEDLPMISYSQGGMFPEVLKNIKNPTLQDILKQLDYTPDTTKGTGASDWGNLGDRMNFIADFFRSAQQDEKLFISPFSDNQIVAIKNGEIPSGKL